MVWGQPIALALSAVASLLTINPLPAYLLATVLSLGLSKLPLYSIDLKRLFRASTGVVIVLAVLCNLATQGIPNNDAMALAFNFFFGLGSASLIWHSVVPRKDL